MQPVPRLFLYAMIVTLGYGISLFLPLFILSHFLYLRILFVILGCVGTTLFASFSKFAKEVESIRQWKMEFERPFSLYPHTQDLKLDMQKISVSFLEPLVMDICMRRREYDEAILLDGVRRNKDIIHKARMQLKIARDRFSHRWKVMSRIGILPINPRTGKAWKDKDLEHFLVTASMKDADISDVVYA